jgi:hypothetical protein
MPAELTIVRPQPITDVLTNPGIGFMTFQRFNGDALNPGTGWTEGYPMDYQPFDGDLAVRGQPLTSLAYHRLYWRFLEPAEGQVRFDLLDRALATAAERGQTLLLRIAPYGTAADQDVPDWYRAATGPEPGLPLNKWRTDPEHPRYAACFSRLIRALGARYDGDPRLESVDLSIVGAWGEGAGSEELTEGTRQALVDAYLDGFQRTPLLMMLTDAATNGYGLSRRAVGWRADCLGDLGGFSDRWCHMYDLYPQQIQACGLADAWRRAPVSLEVCWVMRHWFDLGWDIDYIIEQSLKWHISSFNAKSSAVPEAWQPNVERWLNQMGYRLVPRKIAFAPSVERGGLLRFESWWENRGVAPCYRPFRPALSLSRGGQRFILPLAADLRSWLPGDQVLNQDVTLPPTLPAGEFELALGVLDPLADVPAVRLGVAGRDSDGWYGLGGTALADRNSL